MWIQRAEFKYNIKRFSRRPRDLSLWMPSNSPYSWRALWKWKRLFFYTHSLTWLDMQPITSRLQVGRGSSAVAEMGWAGAVLRLGRSSHDQKTLFLSSKILHYARTDIWTDLWSLSKSRLSRDWIHIASSFKQYRHSLFKKAAGSDVQLIWCKNRWP